MEEYKFVLYVEDRCIRGKDSLIDRVIKAYETEFDYNGVCIQSLIETLCEYDSLYDEETFGGLSLEEAGSKLEQMASSMLDELLARDELEIGVKAKDRYYIKVVLAEVGDDGNE